MELHALGARGSGFESRRLQYFFGGRSLMVERVRFIGNLSPLLLFIKLSLGGNGNEVSRSIDLTRRLPEAFRAFESARRVERHGAGRRPARREPAELSAELEAVTRELSLLIKSINRTNSIMLFEGERTASDALAERGVLAMRRKFYAALAEATTVQQNRYMRTEVKYVSAANSTRGFSHSTGILN